MLFSTWAGARGRIGTVEATTSKAKKMINAKEFIFFIRMELSEMKSSKDEELKL